MNTNSTSAPFKSTVKTPVDKFLKEAQQEYSGNLLRRFFIEFLQNSIDAGAGDIHINYTPESNILSVTDNGGGMDLETLQNGMLTFGGSVKGENSVGGFGAAKKLLLWSHEKYTVTTKVKDSPNWIIINGVGLDYDGEYTPGNENESGTIITVKINENFPWGYNLGSSIEKEEREDRIKKTLEYICLRSNFSVNIRFNGEKVKTGEKTEFKDSNSTAQIFENTIEQMVIIRFNGLYMFEAYSPCNHGYYYDCTGSSRDALSQNRESFRYGSEYYDDYVKFLGKLANNKISGIEASANYKKAAIESKNSPKVYNGILYSGFNIPDKMTKRHKMIYGICAGVYQILTGTFLSKDKFGFWFSDSEKGLHAEDKMWINPTFWDGEWTEKEVYSLVETFIHEYTHFSGYNNHDESFISAFGEYMVQFWINCPGFNPLKKLGSGFETISFQ